MSGEGSVQGRDDKPGADEDRLVHVHSDEVPPSIRVAALELMTAGDTLWRCPRLTGKSKGWSGKGPPQVANEWWLMDSNGDLIEVFWEL